MSPACGRIEAGEHVLALRVYYEDTDAAGMVYYANYLKFAERARTELLRLAGFEQADLARRHQVLFAVRGCRVDYRAPARLDDEIEVRSRLTRLAGATLEARQTIRRGPETLAELELRVACVRPDGRPTRLPAPLKRALEPYISVQ